MTADSVSYIEGIPPGQHNSRLHSGEKSCRFTISIPQNKINLLDLGVINCPEFPPAPPLIILIILE
jgi:hypothetical protein